MEQEFEIRTVAVRQICMLDVDGSDCLGQYHYQGTVQATVKGMLYDHVCNRCGASAQFGTAYPYIKESA